MVSAVPPPDLAVGTFGSVFPIASEILVLVNGNGRRPPPAKRSCFGPAKGALITW
jgi:hypothetical protein